MELTALTSAAVPVRNTSSARYRSLRARSATRTSMPASAAMAITESRVMPGSAPADMGGVTMTSPSPAKMFSPEPSATRPAPFNMMASS